MNAPQFAQTEGYTLQEVPRFVQYTSPVLPGPPPAEKGSSQLPLNLIALIVSYLDDIGDIARVTRTSRLLYYMTLPQLYQHVTLHSYPEIRYVNGRPEGYGSGSPFMMALNGLVTKGHANVVRELRLWGEWREMGAEEFAKGRVPDNSMMLNILLRACVDKMARLRSFSWELDCKPLKTLYHGLASRDTLTSLTIRFPSSRLPRPTVVIPPMPALRVFKATHIDPLCYPDDISLLIAGSHALVDLRLHFSPRMRRSAEPTLNIETFFGRCLSADYKPRLRHFAMQNWFGVHSQTFQNVLDHNTCVGITALDTFGGAHGGSANVYVDETWRAGSRDIVTNFKKLRFNDFAPHHIDILKNSSGLERVYVVNERATLPPVHLHSADKTSNPDLITPSDSPRNPADTVSTADIAQLGHDYVHALTRHHGRSLRHLLLSDQWPLTEMEVADLVRFCPNLEQLGLALGFESMNTIRLLLPFLPKLKVLRILDNDLLRYIEAGITREGRAEILSRDLQRIGADVTRWLGVGDFVYRCGATYEAEGGELRRRVEAVERSAVDHVEIWAMDRLDIMDEEIDVG